MAEDRMSEPKPMPAWIQEIVKQVLPHIDAKFPIGTGWHEDDEDFFEVLFWPALGERVVDGKRTEIHEDFVVHLMAIVDLFEDDYIEDVQASVHASLIALEQTDPVERTILLRFQNYPPANLPPAYEMMDDGSWWRLDGADILTFRGADVVLN